MNLLGSPLWAHLEPDPVSRPHGYHLAPGYCAGLHRPLPLPCSLPGLSTSRCPPHPRSALPASPLFPTALHLGACALSDSPPHLLQDFSVTFSFPNKPVPNGHPHVPLYSMLTAICMLLASLLSVDHLYPPPTHESREGPTLC